AGVGGVDGQRPNVAQKVVNFAERAFRRLDDVGGFLAVGDGLVEAVDLGAQALGDDEAGRIVGCLVDPESAGQLLDAEADRGVYVLQAPKGAQSGNVRVDLQSHLRMSPP